MEEVGKYMIAQGPWGVVCLLLIFALRYMTIKRDEAQAEVSAMTKEGHQSDLALARSLDALGTKVDALGKVIEGIGK